MRKCVKKLKYFLNENRKQKIEDEPFYTILFPARVCGNDDGQAHCKDYFGGSTDVVQCEAFTGYHGRIKSYTLQDGA